MCRRPRLPVDPRLVALFASRGRLRAHRYLQTRDGHDLEDTISTMRTAVALAKETQSAILGPALGNLAALLLEQFKSTGRDAGLNEALQLATWALDCLSDRDADRALVLATLGNILASQYNRSRKSQHLEEAISSLQVATQTQSLPDNGAFLAVVSNNLACVLGRRYENTGRREDLTDAITGALEATEIRLSNYPLLMAGVSSNLASLLARQYESTGKLDSLANALFELRIVTEVSPEFPELDALLGQLGGLAKGQHALRAQPTAERIEVSQSRYPKYSLTLFVILSLSPVLSVVYIGVFYPLVVFLGGIVSNWALQRYNQPMTSGDRPSYLFHSVLTWIQKIFSSPHDPLRFTLTLFSTPWIDAPSTLTLTGSEEEPYNEDKSRRQKSIHTTRFEPGYDQGWRTGARNRFPARDRDRIQNDMDALHRGVKQRPRTPLSHPSPVFPASSRTKCYEDGLKRLKGQKQLSYDHLADSKVWSDANDSPSDSERLGTPLFASEEEEGVNQIDKTKECVPGTPTKRISTTENVKKTDVTYPTESTEAWEKQETISDTVSVSVRCSSKQTVAKAAILASDREDNIPNFTKQVQDDASEQQNKPPSTALSPLKAKTEALTSCTPNQTYPSHQDVQSTEDAYSTLRKDFIDQKFHSRMPPTKLDKESSAFDSVAHGNTSNDINKNEGNAMGNIYSEEAHVVGHLSHHYGGRFETKNISAVLRGYQEPDADQNPPDATLDKLHTENIPQEVTYEYIRGLDKRPAEEQLGDRQPSKVRRKHRTREPSPSKPQIRRRRSYDRLRNYHKPSGSTVNSDNADVEPQTRKSTIHQAVSSSYRVPPDTDGSGDWVDESSDEEYAVQKYKDRQGAEQLVRFGRIVPSKSITLTRPKRRTKERTSAKVVRRSGGTSMPPSAPNLKNFDTSYGQVRALSSYFESTLLPLCNNYVADLPADHKTRELEHKKLSETILTQVLLHADGIEANDAASRAARRKLVKEAQSALNKIDDALRHYD